MTVIAQPDLDESPTKTGCNAQPAEQKALPVISGLACRFPKSPSTAEFWGNLITHENMVSVDDQHWAPTFHGQLPPGKGAVSNQERFDNLFFNMSGSQAERTDPQLRFLLELSYEALVDSNLDLDKLRGSNTGVFVGSCFTDCHKAWLRDASNISGYENTGCAQSMFANRLSFFYDFHGPSFNVDTACSSSLVAFAQACRALQSGECDVALVGGGSVTLHPGVSLAFNRLKMLSADSACQAFSEKANGYARSEGVAVMVLFNEVAVQKYTRTGLPPHVYMRVLASGVNSDGFTPQGITFPNGAAQAALYADTLQKSGVHQNDVVYIEAHGTGTAAGDAQEIEALHKVYVVGRDQTAAPLLLGSVKSNMGHAEGASAMAGLVKLCLAFEQRCMPANLHYSYETRNKACDAMLGDPDVCRVVDTNTPLPTGKAVVAISSFGFGGTNAHAVLECPAVAAGIANVTTAGVVEAEPWRCINPVWGRTEDGVLQCLAKLQEAGVKFERPSGCPAVIDRAKEFPVGGFAAGSELFVTQDADFFVGEACEGECAEKPHGIWLLFSGNGGMWPRMGRDLYFGSATYRAAYDECHAYLEARHGYTGLAKFVGDTPDGATLNDYCTIDGVCGLAAVQIALVRMLTEQCGCRVEGMLGHSAGETALGFADGCLTLEETMDVAYFRSLAGAESVDPENPGAMYACGISRATGDQLLLKHQCTASQVGCDNDPGLITLSGSECEMRPLVQELLEKKVLCRQVPTFGVAYHSASVEPGLPKLHAQLSEVIQQPRRRSARWISTCFDETEIKQDVDHPGNFVSPEYHCVNFRGTVEFQRAAGAIPDNAVVVEVGPSGLFRSSIKKIAAATKKTLHYVSLMAREKNSLHAFQQGYGQLLCRGCVDVCKMGLVPQSVRAVRELVPFTMPLEKDSEVRHAQLRLEVQQSFVQWEHGSDFPLPTVGDLMTHTGEPGADTLPAALAGDHVHVVDFDFEGADAFVLDHVIDGTVLFPACGYVHAVWEAFTAVLRRASKDAAEDEHLAVDVCISDLKIHQGIRLDESNRQLRLVVKFQPGTTLSTASTETHHFQLLSGEDLIVTGGIRLAASKATLAFNQTVPTSQTFGHALGAISAQDFYNRIARNGYHYDEAFRAVEAVAVDDSWAWVNFPKSPAMAAEVMLAEEGAAEGQQRPGTVPEAVVRNRYWIPFLDNLLQVSILPNLTDSETLRVPTFIREIAIRGSLFAHFLTKMHDGSLGASCIAEQGGNDERLRCLLEAQHLNGTVLTRVCAWSNSVRSVVADVAGLRTSIMARSKKAEQETVVRVTRKEIQPGHDQCLALASGPDFRCNSIEAAVATVVAYVAEQFVGGRFNVLDCRPTTSGVAGQLTQHLIDFAVVDRFGALFAPEGESQEAEAAKRSYTAKFQGLFEEEPAAQLEPAAAHRPAAYNVLLAPAALTSSSEACELLKRFLVRACDCEAESWQSSFVLLHEEDSDSENKEQCLSVALLALQLSRVLSMVVPGEHRQRLTLARWVEATPSFPSLTLAEHASSAEVVADVKFVPGFGEVARIPIVRESCEALFVTLHDDCFSGGGAHELSQYLQSLLSKEAGTELTVLRRLFLVSHAPGFPGFVRCLQREPAFARVRGVLLSAGESRECFAEFAEALQAADPRFSVLDLAQGRLLSEAALDTEHTHFPAPFGRFLTFPWPGNLEAHRWKAHPNPEALQRAGSAHAWLPKGSVVLPPTDAVEVHVGMSAAGHVEVARSKYTSSTVSTDSGNPDETLSTCSECSGMVLVDVAYAALNFRDIMLAYNKIDRDALVGHSRKGDGYGLEFAGTARVAKSSSSSLGTDFEKAADGSKVIGLTYNALSNQLCVPHSLVWQLEPHQALKSFATVPCVYATCYYALVVRGRMTAASTVLIHSGAGGVGQAALYISLRRARDPAQVFTTCSGKKRDYLLQKFGPLGLRAANIGSSRDCSFEELVLHATQGRGVDLCLNSLADDKLQASVRCVAAFGSFLEIGKFDLMQNSALGMQCLLKNVAVHGVDLDQLLARPEWEEVHALVSQGLKSGEVVPLDVGGEFSADTEVTEAFRFMAGGTHVGKVLLRFGDSRKTGPQSSMASDDGQVLPLRVATPCQLQEDAPLSAQVAHFSPRNPAEDVYMIVGGLGGFGLELALFLAARGVRYLVLSSRGTLRTGVQAKYLRQIGVLQTSVLVCSADLTHEAGVRELLVQSRAAFGSTTRIAGFFNLGMVLADGLFAKMGAAQWEAPMAAKQAISHSVDALLSELPREQQPDHFVVFSSVSAGMGNAGQTNYGFANSALDAMVRVRNARGQPGLSVQWGAIADVGVLSRTDAKKTGLVKTAVLPQPIQSCLGELEKLLCLQASGVYSVYLAPRRLLAGATTGGDEAEVPLADKILKILGAKNPKDSATLENLGVDSLQGMEIQSLIKQRTGQKIPMDRLNKLMVRDLAALEADSSKSK